MSTYEIQATTKGLLRRGRGGYEDDRKCVKVSLCPVCPGASEPDLMEPLAPPEEAAVWWRDANSAS